MDFTKATPQQIAQAYYNGFQGCIYEPKHMQYFLDNIPHPYFDDAAYQSGIVGSGKGKLSLPFRCVMEFDNEVYGAEAQTTGDCVSHGTRNAVDITRACEILVKGLPFGWVKRGATEPIYGSRGHGGQGMSCSRAAEYVSRIGGIALRQNYEGIVDLTKYNSSIGSSWGGRGGPPEALNSILKQNQVKTVSLIRSVEEARDALANGYGIAVCSGYGFSSTRDENGICRQQGSWSHCMCVGACDDRPETVNKHGGPLFMIINSWGDYVRGGNASWGTIPKSSFMITSNNMSGMIRSGGTFVFSNAVGFPPQKIKDYGTTSFI